jgi:hypothetical protein
MEKRTGKIPWYILVIIAGGAVIRLAHLFFVPFNTPFHLGGLFYEFSVQIIQNHFSMPQTIPYYSLGGLPFAYPPLSFYLQAIVIKLFSPTLFVSVNLLPPLIAVLSLPAFYWMIKGITNDQGLKTAALFAFALMPSAFVNQVEAAGLPEACGTLVLLFYLGWLYRFEKNPRPVPALWAGLFLGLCVLSSPGSAYGAAVISILFFIKILWQDVKRGSYKPSAWMLLIGLVGLLVSAPYWLTIFRHHEFSGLTTAFLTQQDASAFLNQVRYMITFKPADMLTFVGDEGLYGFLFDWLIFAGLIWAVLNKQIFQVLIFFILWMIPREGGWLVAIPAAGLAAMGMVQFLWPLLRKVFPVKGSNDHLPLAPGVLVMILGLLVLFGDVLTLRSLITQPELKISSTVINSLQGDRSMIPADARVIIVGNAALREWAPPLLEREVLNCEFGLEWKPAELNLVYQINEALSANDLAAAISTMHTISGDSHFWLVGNTDQVAQLIANAGESLEIFVQDQNPDLVYAVVNLK